MPAVVGGAPQAESAGWTGAARRSRDGARFPGAARVATRDRELEGASTFAVEGINTALTSCEGPAPRPDRVGQGRRRSVARTSRSTHSGDPRDGRSPPLFTHSAGPGSRLGKSARCCTESEIRRRRFRKKIGDAVQAVGTIRLGVRMDSMAVRTSRDRYHTYFSCEHRGPKHTPLSERRLGVSRVTPSLPQRRCDPRYTPKIARRPLLYSFRFSLPPLRRSKRRWQPAKGVGGIPTDPIATEASSGLLVHDQTQCDAP